MVDSDIVAFFVHVWRQPDGEIVYHRIETFNLEDEMAVIEGARLDLVPRIEEVFKYELIDPKHTRTAMMKTGSWSLYKEIDRHIRKELGSKIKRETQIWVIPNDPREAGA